MKETTVRTLEESDMEPLIDRILSENKKSMSSHLLIALCLQSLKPGPEDYKPWEAELTAYISRRIFLDGSIYIRLPKRK